MSEEQKKSERTVDQIREEYSALCAKVGHHQYQVYTLKREVELMNEQLRDLNFEAASIAAKASKPEEKKEEPKNV